MLLSLQYVTDNVPGTEDVVVKVKDTDKNSSTLGHLPF